MKKNYTKNSRKGGVYRIRNIINNKIYIGSCKVFKSRANGHHANLKYNKHDNPHLQASWNKHGENAFLFEIIEVLPDDKLLRTTREQFYLDEQIKLGNWKNCYNISKKSIVAAWSSPQVISFIESLQKLRDEWETKYNHEPRKKLYLQEGTKFMIWGNITDEYPLKNIDGGYVVV